MKTDLGITEPSTNVGGAIECRKCGHTAQGILRGIWRKRVQCATHETAPLGDDIPCRCREEIHALELVTTADRPWLGVR